jgi:hypothetical protein
LNKLRRAFSDLGILGLLGKLLGLLGVRGLHARQVTETQWFCGPAGEQVLTQEETRNASEEPIIGVIN